MNLDSVKSVDLARIGFGQAVAVTPLQLVTGVSQVVNGGIKVTPHFVDRIVDTTGKEIFKYQSSYERVLSEQTSKKMVQLLENVVSNGSGKKAYIEGYRVGGKTGDATYRMTGVNWVGIIYTVYTLHPCRHIFKIKM